MSLSIEERLQNIELAIVRIIDELMPHKISKEAIKEIDKLHQNIVGPKLTDSLQKPNGDTHSTSVSVPKALEGSSVSKGITGTDVDENQGEDSAQSSIGACDSNSRESSSDFTIGCGKGIISPLDCNADECGEYCRYCQRDHICSECQTKIETLEAVKKIVAKWWQEDRGSFYSMRLGSTIYKVSQDDFQKMWNELSKLKGAQA